MSQSASPHIVQLEQVFKSHLDGQKQIEVLQGVSLEVQPAESVAVVGPSGSGKSTLLHLMGGLDRQYKGRITIAGQELSSLSDSELSAFRASTVGFVFQSFNLLPTCSALENVLLPSWFSRKKGADKNSSPSLKERQQSLEAQAQNALSRVGLAGKEKRLPSQLSGGERQRVAIARALFARPRLLLADEPTGNLDSRTAQGVIELFGHFQAEGLTTVVVTHEERMWKACQRVLVLESGKLNLQEAA